MYRPEEPEVNFDQVMERIRNFFGRFRIGGGGSGGNIGSLIVIGLFAVGIAVWLGSGFFTVQPGEEAALRRLGTFDSIKQPGLHWWWPAPIGARDVIFVDSVRQLEVGVAGGNPVLSESLMITGDADESGLVGEAPNIVDVQLLVQYDIKDIEAYLYRVSDPDGQTIKDVTETALRQVIGSRPIDDVLTDKKEDIQAETKLLLQGLLDSYNTGLNVREVKLLNVFAPEQVKDAFDDVVRAKEDKARMINLADAYKESILPQARGEAARVTEAAEAYKQERIAIAEGQAERFKAILFEYEKAPEVTRQRLFLEAMEEILPGVKMYIMSGETGSSVLPLLPLTDNGQLPTSLGRSQ
ncbi:MAG: FtsH protease activity modulator HflK [Dehalococcoidia bacterium]|nr:FtsH protease activity modulator HflK [Dehalococcoidia bacterium]